jgi:predicted membrane channel-forming protein YqfA (hemolysin III family)
MTFDDLVPAWQSPGNAPDIARLERLKRELVDRLAKEHRNFRVHVGMAAAFTIFLAGAFFQYVRDGGAFDLAREWGSLVFLLLPVGVAAFFLRGFIAHRQAHPHYDLSIAAALRAMLDENRLARARLRVSMAVATIAMALTPLITHQLALVGKQRPHEAASMLAAFGVMYAIAMAWQVWKYRAKLLPERERLERLCKSYEE